MSRNDHNDNSYDFDKDLNFDIELDFDVNVNIDIYKEVEIDGKIEWDVDVKGNTAQLTLDAEAFGDNTLVEVDAVVFTTDFLSSITLHVISVTD